MNWLCAGAAVLLAVACSSHTPAPVTPEPVVAPVPDAGPAEPTPEQIEREKKQIAAIAAAVNAHQPQVYECWARAAAHDLRVGGDIELRLVMGSSVRDGIAGSTVSVASSSVSDPGVGLCLVALWTDVTWPPLFEPGDEIRLPFSFVAPAAQYRVSAAHARIYPLGSGTGAAASSVSIVLDYKNTGNAAAGMSIYKLAPGMVVPKHTHNSAELLFVVSGAGKVTDVRGWAQAVIPATAIYIDDGVVHGFEATGTEPAVLVGLYAPGGAEQRFKGIDVGGTKAHDGSVVRRGRRPLVRAVPDVKRYPIAGGKGHVSILFDRAVSGDRAASIGTITIGAGVTVPEHTHDKATELLFVLAGAGTMKVDDVEIPVQAYDAVQVPPGVRHSFTVTEGPVKAVQFYTPAGPEQRFKKAAPR